MEVWWKHQTCNWVHQIAIQSYFTKKEKIAIKSCKRVTEVEESPYSTLSFKIGMQHRLCSSQIYASQIIMTFFCLTPNYLHQGIDLPSSDQSDSVWARPKDLLYSRNWFHHRTLRVWSGLLKHRLHKIKVLMLTDASIITNLHWGKLNGLWSKKIPWSYRYGHTIL